MAMNNHAEFWFGEDPVDGGAALIHDPCQQVINVNGMRIREVIDLGFQHECPMKKEEKERG